MATLVTLLLLYTILLETTTARYIATDPTNRHHVTSTYQQQDHYRPISRSSPYTSPHGAVRQTRVSPYQQPQYPSSTHRSGLPASSQYREEPVSGTVYPGHDLTSHPVSAQSSLIHDSNQHDPTLSSRGELSSFDAAKKLYHSSKTQGTTSSSILRRKTAATLPTRNIYKQALSSIYGKRTTQPINQTPPQTGTIPTSDPLYTENTAVKISSVTGTAPIVDTYTETQPISGTNYVEKQPVVETSYNEKQPAKDTIYPGTGPVVDTAYPGTGPVVDTAYPGTGPVVDSAYPGTGPVVDTAYPGKGPVVDTAYPGKGPVVDTAYPGTGPVVDTAYTGAGPVVDTAYPGAGPVVDAAYPGTGPVVDTAYPGAGHVVDTAYPGAGPVVDAAYPVTGPVVDTAYPGTGPVVDTAYPGTGPVVDTAYPVTGPVVDTAYPGTVPVVDTAYPGTGPVVDTAYPVTGPVVDTAYPVTGPVVDTAYPGTGPVVDTAYPGTGPVVDTAYPGTGPVVDTAYPGTGPVVDTTYPGAGPVVDTPYQGTIGSSDYTGPQSLVESTYTGSSPTDVAGLGMPPTNGPIHPSVQPMNPRLDMPSVPSSVTGPKDLVIETAVNPTGIRSDPIDTAFDPMNPHVDAFLPPSNPIDPQNGLLPPAEQVFDVSPPGSRPTVIAIDPPRRPGLVPIASPQIGGPPEAPSPIAIPQPQAFVEVGGPLVAEKIPTDQTGTDLLPLDGALSGLPGPLGVLPVVQGPRTLPLMNPLVPGSVSQDLPVMDRQPNSWVWGDTSVTGQLLNFRPL